MSATIYQFRRPMASMDDLPAVERTRDYQCQLYPNGPDIDAGHRTTLP